MRDLCPMCMKIGVSSKIILVQFNFEEAVWTCESEKCHYPFGYTDEEIIERHVWSLNDWSNNWPEPLPQKQKKVSTDGLSALSLYTPPLTPASENGNKECIVQSALVTADNELSGAFNPSDEPNTSNLDSKLNLNTTEVLPNENSVQDTNFEHTVEGIANTSTELISDLTTGVEIKQLPNIEESTIKNEENGVEKCQVQIKSIVNNKTENHVEMVKLQTKGPQILKNITLDSSDDRNVKRVIINGLPHAMISNPASNLISTSIFDPDNAQKFVTIPNNIKLKLVPIQKFSAVHKKGLYKAMKYQKFSFSKLRQKVKEENSDTKQEEGTTNVNENSPSNSETVLPEEDTKKISTDTVTAMEVTSTSSDLKNSIPDNILPTSGLTEEEIAQNNDLDSLLHDFMVKENQNPSHCPDDDDWLTSFVLD